MRKWVISLLALCVLVLCLPIVAGAEIEAPKINFDTTKEYTAGQTVTFTVSAKGQDDIRVAIFRDGSEYAYSWCSTVYNLAELSQETIANTELTASMTITLKPGVNYITARGDGWDDKTEFITEKTLTATSGTFIVVPNVSLAPPTVEFTPGTYTTLDNMAGFTIKGTPYTNVNLKVKKGNDTVFSDYEYLGSSGTYTSSAYLDIGPGDYYIEAYLDDGGANISPTVKSAAAHVGPGQLKEPEIWVSGESLLYAQERLRVSFDENATQSINYDNVAVKYTITRDADGADVSVMPRSVERTVTLGYTYDITDGLIAGSYTISAKIVDTNGWYIDSPYATKKVTVTSNILPKLALDKDEEDYRIGDTVTVTITAPGHNTVQIHYYDEAIKNYRNSTLALVNGTATFTSAPLPDGLDRNFRVDYADTMACSVGLTYYASLPEPQITLDKETYLVGDTARITISGQSAEYFTVELYCDYDDDGSTLLSRINYAATNGQAVIDLPFTEPGSFTVRALSCNDSYQIRSYYWAGESADVYSAEDQPVELAAPTVKVAPAAKGLTVSWSSVGAQTYNVLRSVGGAKFETIAEKLTGTSFTDTSVAANKVVVYKVKAVTKNASGTYTSESNMKSYMLLAQPKKPTAKSKTAKTMDLSWKKVKNADSYDVYYSTSKTAPAMTAKATKNTKDLKLSVKKLKAGKTYYVYVRAVHKLDDGTKVIGPWSKAAKVKIAKK